MPHSLSAFHLRCQICSLETISRMTAGENTLAGFGVSSCSVAVSWVTLKMTSGVPKQ